MKSTGKRTGSGERGKRSSTGSSKDNKRKGASSKSSSSRYRDDAYKSDRGSKTSSDRSSQRDAREERSTRSSSARPSRAGKGGEERSYGSSRLEGSNTRSTGYSKPGGRSTGGAKRPYTRSDESGERSSYSRGASSDRKPYTRSADGGSKRPYTRSEEGGERKPYNRSASSDRKPYTRSSDTGAKRPYTRSEEGGERKTYGRSSPGDRKPYTRAAASERRPYTRSEEGGERKPYGRSEETSGAKRPYTHRSEDGERSTFNREDRDFKSRTRKATGDTGDAKPRGRRSTEVRLNKFLSNAGIASRRDADKLIELGLVSVNGKVVTELGHKIDPAKDVVRYDSVVLKPEPMRYVLLNKPKDYMTTLEETDKRKSVMALIDNACNERIYPVGRLDRQTTGLLLFTNDGDIAKRLTNPQMNIPKLYHVETVEKIRGEHLDAFRAGVEIEDGFAKVEDIAFVNDDTHQVGVRIDSGRSRIVRHLFEHFGYTIKKLDRVMYAGLTKKDLPRGRYRHLSEQEVNFLRMIR
jgi:23S rRNA pseudouridine2605 synthase